MVENLTAHLNGKDSHQLSCPGATVKRELGILARFLLELNSS